MTELIVGLTSLSWVIIHFYLSERLKYKKEAVDPLIHNIFIRFYYQIELNLFKKINKQNFIHIRTNIFQLKKMLKKGKLEFYLDDYFLMYLNKIYIFLKTNSSFEKLTNREKFYLQLYYQRFSYGYFKQLNKSKKMLNLPTRKLDYIREFELYYNKFVYWISFGYFVIKILFYFTFVYIIIAILIVVTYEYLPLLKELISQ